MRDLPGLEDVEEIGWGAEATGNTPFFASGRWDVEPVDLVLTFRNYHNFSRDARMAVNESSFDALKPGGLYGIVDHTRRHMEPDNSENGRRMDPVLVIKETGCVTWGWPLSLGNLASASLRHKRPNCSKRCGRSSRLSSIRRLG